MKDIKLIKSSNYSVSGSIHGPVSTLVVEWDSVLIVRRSTDAGSTMQCFLHLWLRARSTIQAGPRARTAIWTRTRSTSKVRVTPNWCKMGRPCSEIMFRQRFEMAYVWTSNILVTLCTAGVERRSIGCGAMETGYVLIVRWLEVDRLHPIFKLGRRPELPLANEGPDNCDTTNTSGNGNDDSNCGATVRRDIRSHLCTAGTRGHGICTGHRLILN